MKLRRSIFYRKNGLINKIVVQSYWANTESKYKAPIMYKVKTKLKMNPKLIQKINEIILKIGLTEGHRYIEYIW